MKQVFISHLKKKFFMENYFICLNFYVMKHFYCTVILLYFQQVLIKVAKIWKFIKMKPNAPQFSQPIPCRVKSALQGRLA